MGRNKVSSKKAMEGLQAIRDYCSKMKCEACAFHTDDSTIKAVTGNGCVFNYGMPLNWYSPREIKNKKEKYDRV